ncbi:MAG: hypothetical protein KAJ46_03595 [Sedimentisphaerales bacterium]|nr:hypothetical protein [Sedimentisphaerales bacterium]
MPRNVKVIKGKSLCTIAIQNGKFLNCNSLRNEDKNKSLTYENGMLKPGQMVFVPDKKPKKVTGKATEKQHVQVRKGVPVPSVRFVHGSKSKPFASDVSLSSLQISNYRTDKWSYVPDKNALDTWGFNKYANMDSDIFKVEVTDPGVEGDEVTVQLETLRPKYGNDGITYKTIDSTETDADKCIIEVKCKRVGDKKKHKRFRSKYIRLVIDNADFDATPGRTLLVKDIADGSDGDDDKVEILDHLVRASYTVASCSMATNSKCKVYKELPIGLKSRKKRVKIIAHILRDGRGGNGVMTINNVRKGCLQYIRQIYAQAELGVKFIDPKIHLIQPPTNLIAVENEKGRRAVGNKKIKIKIEINDTIDKTVEYTTKANDTPIVTARKLAALIKKEIAKEVKKHLNFPEVEVVASGNPAIIGKTRGSADVIVGDPEKHKVKLTSVEQTDNHHKVSFGRIASTEIAEFGNNDGHVGTLQERVLIKNYDTGKNRIDIFVIGSLPASWGEAFTPSKDDPVARRPYAKIVNTVLVDKSTIDVSTQNYHSALPHEMGHVLMDSGHVNPATELMGPGSPVGANERQVGGPKRISDQKRSYIAGFSENPVVRIRTKNRTLINEW